MTSDTEPRTAAGRTFASRLWAVNDYAAASQAISGVFRDVRAIEDESWNAALSEAFDKVTGLRNWLALRLEVTPEIAEDVQNAVLAAIASLRKPVTP